MRGTEGYEKSSDGVGYKRDAETDAILCRTKYATKGGLSLMRGGCKKNLDYAVAIFKPHEYGGPFDWNELCSSTSCVGYNNGDPKLDDVHDGDNIHDYACEAGYFRDASGRACN